MCMPHSKALLELLQRCRAQVFQETSCLGRVSLCCLDHIYGIYGVDSGWTGKDKSQKPGGVLVGACSDRCLDDFRAEPTPAAA